jgi:hypothetical protein
MPRALPSRVLEIPAGWPSREAASFMKQLEFLSARRFSDLEGCGAAELSWQPRPGANTIGMLLAHVEIVEVFWLLLALDAWKPARMQRILGIGVDDDGLPLPAGGRPPAPLSGRTLAWYRKLHKRARAFTSRTLRALKPADLRRVIEVKRSNGKTVRVNVRWILFHILEHEAGHYGQMLLLRHQYRDRIQKR